VDALGYCSYDVAVDMCAVSGKPDDFKWMSMADSSMVELVKFKWM
jgi:hypothetical protein